MVAAAVASNNNNNNNNNNSRAKSSMDNNEDVIATTSTIIASTKKVKTKKEVMDEENDGDDFVGTTTSSSSNSNITQYEDGIVIGDNDRWCNVDDVCNYMGGLNNSTIDDSTCYNVIQKKKDSNNSHIIEDLSYVGKATYEILKMKHGTSKTQQWNITNGKVVGKLHQTPKDAFTSNSNTDELRDGQNDDWFPEIISSIMKRTEVWCDICSLTAPDGLFLEKMKEALTVISETSKRLAKKQYLLKGKRRPPIVVRMMFANIIGLPLNCNEVVKELTSHLSKDDPDTLRLWVGAWRRDTSWNHAKIIAVDGKYLHTGGHNLWDQHYLKINPIHDLSIELEGDIANNAHNFTNTMWSFIEAKQETLIGNVIDKLPDNMRYITRNRVTVTEYPTGIASEHPPMYREEFITKYIPKHNNKTGSDNDDDDDDGEDEWRQYVTSTRNVDPPPTKSDIVPMISVGRYGTMVEMLPSKGSRHINNNSNNNQPADDAFIAMLGSAKYIIRMVLQDLGPIQIPGTKRALPGLQWPHETLRILGKVIWERDVDVEIVLSNLGSVPGGLNKIQSCYSNGWTCDDVGSEIIKTIREQFPEADDEKLRRKVENNLRICYLRHKCGNKWSENDIPMGLHSKHFIVDDMATYIGSQNLYVCNLAEWGVVIDDINTAHQFMEEYWKPMWYYSYRGIDCDVHKVMDGLDIDRDGDDDFYLDDETRKLIRTLENPDTRKILLALEENSSEDNDDDNNINAASSATRSLNINGKFYDNEIEKDEFPTVWKSK